MGRIVIPFMIGAVKASVITIALGTLNFLAVKAFLIAKIAAVVSLLSIFSKYWKKDSPVEVEQLDTQHYPMYDLNNAGR